MAKRRWADDKALLVEVHYLLQQITLETLGDRTISKESRQAINACAARIPVSYIPEPQFTGPVGRDS